MRTSQGATPLSAGPLPPRPCRGHGSLTGSRCHPSRPLFVPRQRAHIDEDHRSQGDEPRDLRGGRRPVEATGPAAPGARRNAGNAYDDAVAAHRTGLPNGTACSARHAGEPPLPVVLGHSDGR